MSPIDVISEHRRAWYQHPLVATLFAPLLLSVLLSAATGAASVWLAQHDTAKEIGDLKTRQQATDQRVDADRREREEQLEVLKDTVVTKELLDAKWKAVEKIERTTDQLLQIQLEERRRR